MLQQGLQVNATHRYSYRPVKVRRGSHTACHIVPFYLGLTGNQPLGGYIESYPPGAIAGIAVEAVILALTLVGLGFVMWRNRLLNEKVREAEAAAVVARNTPQYQWQHPSSRPSTVQPSMAPYGYNPIEETQAKRSELHSSSLGAYSELPGAAVGTEPSSTPATPRSPDNPLNR
ncbi:hypothetical protein AAE478_009329 [Parahypoxylon ruwenzoriense]